MISSDSSNKVHFNYQNTSQTAILRFKNDQYSNINALTPTVILVPQNSPSWFSTCVVGMTVAVGVGVGTVAGVIMGRMLARGVDLFPGLTGGLLWPWAPRGVGLMLAVGGSEVLAL